MCVCGTVGGGGKHHSLAFTCIKIECPTQARMGGGGGGACKSFK